MKDNSHEKDHPSMSRRKFLAFLGSSATAIAVASSGLGPLVGKADAAASAQSGISHTPKALPFPSLQPKKAAKLIVPNGYAADSIAAPGHPVRSGGGAIGTGGRFVAYYPGASQNEGLLWISHTAEAAGKAGKGPSQDAVKTRGASILGLRREPGGAWTLDASSKQARRIAAVDRVALTGPASGSKAVHGASVAQGLWSNGSGGRTPWGTVLAGESPSDGDALSAGVNPLTCGWLAEADPQDASFQPRKHTALGRFSHGDAAVTLSKDGRAVVYMGGEHVLYKFVSSGKYDAAAGTGNSALLQDGILYAADLALGRWIELNVRSARKTLADPAFRMPEGVLRLREELLDMLKGTADMLVNAHEVALVLGATKLDHAFGIALHPADQSLFVAQTGSDGSGSSHGSILRMAEKAGDAGAEEFEADPVITGGRQAALSSPAAIVFDSAGRLWVASGIASERLNQGAYAAFGHNGLHVFSPNGETFGKADIFAIAPDHSAISLPAFGPDGSLFALVSHLDASSKHNVIAAVRSI